MSSRVIFIGLFLVTGVFVFGQRLEPRVTFSADNNGTRVQLDSIKLINRSGGGITTLYWPDSVISMELAMGDMVVFVGYATNYEVYVPELIQGKDRFELFQNFPNPVFDKTTVNICLPESGNLDIVVNDLQGRILASNDWDLGKGTHSFQFVPGKSSIYFITARWNGKSQTIKILNAGQQSTDGCNVSYSGSSDEIHSLKATSLYDGRFMESGFVDSPSGDTSYTFQFASNIPCSGSPVVEYGGQVYHTVQIFNQCWLKENLNIGTMISAQGAQTDNGVIEKYCYNNDEEKCEEYGGLYRWQEMMQYGSITGSQGICPPGWHVPVDEEWKVLEGAADMEYGICASEWDINYAYRGYDVGTMVKSSCGWKYYGNGSDKLDFAGLPGGACFPDNIFMNAGYIGNWWTSTQNNYNCAINRYLDYQYNEIGRSYEIKDVALSVRCLKDE
jgi:uncharacterized protein (TIGR02145 family)